MYKKTIILASVILDCFTLASAQSRPLCNLIIMNNSNVKVMDALNKVKIEPSQSVTVKTSVCVLPNSEKSFSEIKAPFAVKYELKSNGDITKTIAGKAPAGVKEPIVLE